MNGIRYWADTNAVMAIVNGNAELILGLNEADLVAFSVIRIVESPYFPGLPLKDKKVFKEMVEEGDVIDLGFTDGKRVESIVCIGTGYRLKLRDTILAATASTNNGTLITNNREFYKIPALSIINFKPEN